MNPRTGRPPSDNPRTRVYSIRLTQQEAELIDAAAQRAGADVGPWMRSKVLAAAKRTP